MPKARGPSVIAREAAALMTNLDDPDKIPPGPPLDPGTTRKGTKWEKARQDAETAVMPRRRRRGSKHPQTVAEEVGQGKAPNV